MRETSVGRPLKFNEETKVVGFRVPLSAEKTIREMVNKHLNELLCTRN